MRHKSIIPVLLPLLLALLLLSLPITLNLSLKDQIGLSFSRLWAFLHANSEKECDKEKKEELLAYLESQKEKQVKTKESAIYTLDSLEKEKIKASNLIVGKVIYRSIHTWNSFLWIDVGSDDNPKNGPVFIAKNSPVLAGDKLVGVLDFVGKNTSLVRLISDSGLNPSVRAARGAPVKSCLADHLFQVEKLLIEDFDQEKTLFSTVDERKNFLHKIRELKQKLHTESKTKYLAKGELQGIAEPLWRTSGVLLRGVGFNYDFLDQHGPARDLRTGELVDEKLTESANESLQREALLQVGDILVTSGLDGLFPEGLKVCRIHHILPLQEGAYSYELLAEPLVHLSELDTLFILPPQPEGGGIMPTKVEKILQSM